MKNVSLKVTGTKLTIEVDLSKDFGPTKSDKSIMIASTGGFVIASDGTTKVSLNVVREKPTASK